MRASAARVTVTRRVTSHRDATDVCVDDARDGGEGGAARTRGARARVPMDDDDEEDDAAVRANGGETRRHGIRRIVSHWSVIFFRGRAGVDAERG
jgi:hypothetical protein